MLRLDKHVSFMLAALAQGARSTCQRRAVGCVLVDTRGRISGTGFNGVARDAPHCIDEPCLGVGLPSGQGLDLCMAIHAEQNALAHCKDTMEIDAVYCTSFPCAHCLKMIMNTSAQSVFFMHDYPNALVGHGLMATKLIDPILAATEVLLNAQRSGSITVGQDEAVAPTRGAPRSEHYISPGPGHRDI